MSRGWIGQIVVVAALGTLGVAAAGPRVALPEPIVTQRTSFAIPFSVPAASPAQSAPVQVVLLVSRDLGVSWRTYGQVPPEAGHFVFQADTDGEYWFNIQNRDRAGNSWPRLTEVPGLRVRVDTTPPQVRVSARRGESGEVTAQWRIDDANFRPEGVKVSYRSNDDTEFQDVALSSHHHSRSGDAFLGEVTWWLRQDVRAIEVRIEATDKASNRSVATATAEMASAAPPPDRSTDTSVPGESSPATPPQRGGYGQPWPAQPYPSVASEYRPQKPGGGGDAPLLLPPPGQVRPVNSRLFELEFDVDSMDPATISHVELWGTRDGGRSWRSISMHQGGRSPILAKADEEGIYGYRVVVHGRSGASRTPQPGDPPDIWIRVDLTKPVARITSAEEGAGPEAGHLIITWTAEDVELADEPVSLAYGPRQGGPWTTIAKELPNSGRYVWPRLADAPGPIYLRLEVRDAAGNAAEFETNQPVVLDRAPPKVHIREVRPLSDASGQAAPRRYIFR